MNLLHIDSAQGNTLSQLQQNFDHTFALPPSMDSPLDEDLLTIRVSGDPYAIRLVDIAEIISGCSVVSVPSVMPDLLGLAGIHGGIIPVFDLSSILGYGPDPGSPRWMTLCGSEEPVALAFSEFEGYLRLQKSALHADEDFREKREHVKYVTNIANTPDGARAVISIPLIMANIRNRTNKHRPTKES
jgi:chemotaxis signal transduction protein